MRIIARLRWRIVAQTIVVALQREQPGQLRGVEQALAAVAEAVG
jgi:hypothetical protein